tara:strand:- start:1918 stop:2346 length:429 start_codon:yes stop_codon:yes gene_type:complete
MTTDTQFRLTFECDPVFNVAVILASHIIEKVDPFGELHCIVDDYNVEDEHLSSARDRWHLMKPEERMALEALESLSLVERETAVVLGSGCLWMFDEIAVDEVSDTYQTELQDDDFRSAFRQLRGTVPDDIRLEIGDDEEGQD